MASLDNEIEVDCISALAGASEARNRVLSGLALGYPSVESSAYLIKCRVKEHASLVKKVKDRRAKGNSEYSAKSATDIIGLRLLALYRKDIPTLVSRFLSFVKAGQSEEFSLFVGGEFRSACTEIILYTAAPLNDEVDSLVADEFRRQGLSVEVIDIDSDPSTSKADVKIVRKDSQYSSIHLILWCRNSISRQAKHKIPMEVQIRTSLEDVWGEIDHGLSYKNEKVTGDESAKKFISSAKEQLKTLKLQLDACSGSADTIAKQMQYADPTSGSTTVQTSALSVNLGTLNELSVPKHAEQDLSKAVSDLKAAFQELSQGMFTESRAKVEKLCSVFDECGKAFEQILEETRRQLSADPEEKTKSLYYLLMEAALCYYWSGKVIGASVENAQQRDGAREAAAKFFEKSLKLYNEVGPVIDYFQDAILAYRIANVLAATGQEEIALKKFREATRNLQDFEQPNLSANHFLRVRIPRQYGIAIWESAERIREQGEKNGLADFLSDERQKLYLEAISATKPLLDLKTEYDIDAGEFDRPADGNDKITTMNNILDYSLCYIRAGGDENGLAKIGISRSDLEDFSGLIAGEEEDEKIEVPFILDTLRAARQELLADLAGAKRAALRLVGLVESKKEHWILSYGERFVAEMLEDAKKTLDMPS